MMGVFYWFFEGGGYSPNSSYTAGPRVTAEAKVEFHPSLDSGLHFPLIVSFTVTGKSDSHCCRKH